MSETPDPIGLPAQLEAITQQLEESNPALYRHLALYLQVLRQVLPQRVRQACFHLATQVHPQRYTALPEERRGLLHSRIDGLVGRCSSLLTVEQLAVLAHQIHREGQRRERHDHRQILAELSLGLEVEAGSEADAPADLLPPGSVCLSFAPPLTGLPQSWGAFLPAETGRPAGHGQVEPFATGSGGADADDSGVTTSAAGVSAAEAADEAGSAGEEMERAGFDPVAADQEASTLWQRQRLPREPRLVLQWLDGMELALGRRLRNLSHAVNVELLRAGLNRSLLPVSLLDAVLAGQLETLAAPANLLRLSLPFGGNADSGQAQTMAVLLRTVELELEEPKLRTCRRRLQQHRQEVRRMAQQFRRLQRRLRIHQAEQLWLQDTSPLPDPSD
ncbi:MAG: hypothetical protein ER33_01515 [Cyanobium sp. CACIAM 14]|nr:MAG: hypothetical protein ER33_01515 [Cyanobium sp. CACIAM 14]